MWQSFSPHWSVLLTFTSPAPEARSCFWPLDFELVPGNGLTLHSQPGGLCCAAVRGNLRFLGRVEIQHIQPFVKATVQILNDSDSVSQSYLFFIPQNESRQTLTFFGFKFLMISKKFYWASSQDLALVTLLPRRKRVTWFRTRQGDGCGLIWLEGPMSALAHILSQPNTFKCKPEFLKRLCL